MTAVPSGDGPLGASLAALAALRRGAVPEAARPLDAAALLDRLAPRLGHFGISRVGDLTGLDRIGIPVWFATRPNARALAVSQGKGLDAGQARLSAILEAIEGAVAERPKAIVARFGTPADLARAGLRTLPLDGLARVVPAGFDAHAERAWVAGLSWRTGETVFAPYELIGCDMRADMPWDHGAFRMSSVGLAAGPEPAGAILHALGELVEHDATALFDVPGLGAGIGRRLIWRPGRHAGLDEAVARIRAAGLNPAFLDLTRDIALPVIGAFLDWPDPTGGRTRLCAGFACRADPSDAALAALLEAAQSRLTEIAGARDDIVAEEYAMPERRLPPLGPDAVAIDAIGAAFAPRPSGPVAALHKAIARVFDAGIDDIHVFPLEREGDGVSVVRVLSPGLDCAAPEGAMRLGPRALDALFGRGTARA